MASTTAPSVPIGALLRDWRRLRSRTQLDLALSAGISTRHLSCVETGRAHPGAEVVLAISDELEIPFRERNQLLLAAGYAPVFPQRTLEDPDLDAVREAIELILEGHEPFPAMVIDRHWNLVAANRAMLDMARFVDSQLLDDPINVMRLGLHPLGLARWMTNLDHVYAYFVRRLERQVEQSADPALVTLLDEVRSYRPLPHSPDAAALATAGHIVSPTIDLQLPDGHRLAIFATVATFGTATEVTTSELSIELGFPADEQSAALLRATGSAQSRSDRASPARRG